MVVPIHVGREPTHAERKPTHKGKEPHKWKRQQTQGFKNPRQLGNLPDVANRLMGLLIRPFDERGRAGRAKAPIARSLLFIQKPNGRA